ncbi:hypothetical protein GCM10022267_75680 [Lentzea roselyniae]|uniref:PE family protein n=1 Tax=Lentzea roselyniae TaxID=531940 RepID=A0ABP7C651_9PSEU
MPSNITFDEEKYNQLIKVMDDIEASLLRKATTVGPDVLDSEFALQPGSQQWQAAQTLVAKGKEFGGSVEQQQEQLRQDIVKFRNALEAAKSVFKETDDLAQYDVARFVSEYPDFNTGGVSTTPKL